MTVLTRGSSSNSSFMHASSEFYVLGRQNEITFM